MFQRRRMRRNEMRMGVLCICAVFLFAAGTVRAQQPDQDLIGQSFFAPELVIQHQEAIGLAAEREVKREQVTLLVRIKNKLTPEQQGKLSELRSKPANK